jgi:hypothetical protein
MNVQAPILHSNADTEAAWREYRDDVEAARNMVLSQPCSADPQVRAQGLYLIQMLQAFGFNIYVAPRQAYPNFYVHAIFMPFEMGFGAPCPDFFYRWTFLDGARSYRIRGKLGTTRWVEFQLHRGFWGDKDQGHLGAHDMDDFKVEADGSFEIIASANRHEGNWIKLDSTVRNITVITREAWYDWNSERGLELHIEAVDAQPTETMIHSEAEMNRRIRAVGYLTRFDVEFFVKLNQQIVNAAGYNAFFVPPLRASENVGGNPRAAYWQMVYELDADEALIVETDIPDARYWSLQLADRWWQTLDYTHHHGSLNGHQARLDHDGKCRFVICAQDPGVPNWLDTVGVNKGVALGRWYLADHYPTPTVTRVKLNDVRNHLPTDTPVVTPIQRQAVIEKRKQATLRRYGF